MQLTNRTTPDLQHLARHAIATHDVALGQAVSAVIRGRAQLHDALYCWGWTGWCDTHGKLYLGDVGIACPFCGEDMVPF